MTLEEQFAQSLADHLKKIEALGIPTVRMTQQAGELGAVNLARRCLRGHRCSDGFPHLSRLGRLNLSLEALVLEPASGSLFTDEEINEALSRLLDAGYDFRQKKIHYK